MSFGMAKGVNWETFRKLVKTVKVVVLTQTERREVDVPVEQFWNLPVSHYRVEL